MRAFLVVLAFSASVLGSAQTLPDRLDGLADELDTVVADLVASQQRTHELQEQLGALELLASDHETTLTLQRERLAGYESAVGALEAHDRAALAAADELRAQLGLERAVSAWLWPVAAAGVLVAVVEAVLLVARAP